MEFSIRTLVVIIAIVIAFLVIIVLLVDIGTNSGEAIANLKRIFSDLLTQTSIKSSGSGSDILGGVIPKP
ncbi:MAG: hypothetical protein KKA90_02030 [Nanoarchaeota archaeon]|nr:hypothetical protein [Nanoarchaeota archaeon]